MLSNIKYILNKFVTLNKKAMRHLTIILLVLSVNLSAQFVNKTYDYNKKNDHLFKQPDVYIPVTILASTFLINEYILMHESTVEGKSTKTSTVFFTGAVVSVGSYFLLTYLKKHKPCRKKRINYKHKY